MLSAGLLQSYFKARSTASARDIASPNAHAAERRSSSSPLAAVSPMRPNRSWKAAGSDTPLQTFRHRRLRLRHVAPLQHHGRQISRRVRHALLVVQLRQARQRLPVAGLRRPVIPLANRCPWCSSA